VQWEGTEAALQSYVSGLSQKLPTGAADAIQTMRIVEAAYRSSERGGEEIVQRTDK